MAKVGKNIENYQHVGNFTWREAIVQGKAVGVLTVSPHPDMLTAKGYKKDISNAASQTYVTVSFDEDYVLEFLHRKIVLGLNFMEGEKLDREQYLKLIDKQINYSLAESTRESDAKLIKDAQDMSDRYGNTLEYWLETLKNATKVSTEKVASNNNKVREKVAA